MRKPEYCINSHYCAIFAGQEVLLSVEGGIALDKKRNERQKKRPAAAHAERRAGVLPERFIAPRQQRLIRRQVYAGDGDAVVYRPGYALSALRHPDGAAPAGYGPGSDHRVLAPDRGHRRHAADDHFESAPL